MYDFTLNVVGETSGDVFKGVFEVKPNTSLRDTVREDEVRRGLIGSNPDGVDPLVAGICSTVAYLKIRLVKSPKWWEESGFGFNLEDENVLVAVFKETEKIVNKVAEEKRAKALAAQKELKGHLENLDIK